MSDTNHTENYQSFMERSEIFFPHEDVVRISVAYDMAKGHHAHLTRKSEKNPDGTPVRYFEHVRRVALILMDEGEIVDSPNIVIKGLLHDAYEDTRLGHEAIRMVFGEEVSRDVLMMSKRPKAGFAERLLRHGSWEVLAVKVADRVDNLRHLPADDPGFVQKQYDESRTMYGKVLNRMEALSTTPKQAYVTGNLWKLFHDSLSRGAQLLLK